jgi:hypothetical protein
MSKWSQAKAPWHTAPPALAEAITRSAAQGRALCTVINGHTAIILPERYPDTDDGAELAAARIAKAARQLGCECPQCREGES